MLIFGTPNSKTLSCVHKPSEAQLQFLVLLSIPSPPTGSFLASMVRPCLPLRNAICTSEQLERKCCISGFRIQTSFP